MSWYDSKGNILVTDLSALMEASRDKIFGEIESEDLVTYLMCSAFEHRFSPRDALALHLAAMIISRVEKT